MNLSRRDLLRAGALAGVAVGAGGCEGVYSWIAETIEPAIDGPLALPADVSIDPERHLLDRAAFGPSPRELERLAAMGREAWLEEQLRPESIDDRLCDLRARRFETIHHEPGTCYEYKRPVLREEIVRHTLLRAVYSRRQLHEVMVGFWTDHLNVTVNKGDCIYLKATDDRRVIRRHALGRFGDLIRASATSPAMLVYLDGKENRVAGPGDVPNENYARELLELHTLGVHGGYTQADVFEVARCLTGWRLREGWRRGTVVFDPDRHDSGAKVVLGKTIAAGGGAADLDRVVEIVCAHPATARHIARKLAVRLVSEDPPAELVERAAKTFRVTDGEIAPVVRTILESREFEASRGVKVKRPFRFLVSALRALAADTHAHRPLWRNLTRMGQEPFGYPTPDGYPEEGAHWLGTLLWRWNFAFALVAREVGGVEWPLADLVAALSPGADGVVPTENLLAYLLGRAGTEAERAALDRFAAGMAGGVEASHRGRIGLILASPAFQRH